MSAIDVYSACPGGACRKIKYCACAKDMLGDLEKVLVQIDGEQRVAALSRINSLLEKKGTRECLLSLKAMTLMMLGDYEQSAGVAETFLGAYPRNPLALAYSALASVNHGNVDEAIDRLQSSIEESEDGFHDLTFQAAQIIGQMLLSQGRFLAGRAHFEVHAAFEQQTESDESRQILASLNATPNVLLLLKENVAPDETPPADTNLHDEFRAAVTDMHRCCWRRSLQTFERLAERAPQTPSLWRNIAILRGWLAHETASAEAWTRYARLPGVTPEDAVLAEVFAMVLTPDEARPMLEEVCQVYTLADSERVLEMLLSNRHLVRMEFDPADGAEEGEPPPKAMFYLLDRPMPSGEGDEVPIEAIPNVIGDLHLYGKQTDRDARLEFYTLKNADFEDRVRALTQSLGEHVRGLEIENVVNRVSISNDVFHLRYRLPQGVSVTRRYQVNREKLRDMILNHWPRTPVAELDGHSPQAVAGNPDYRTRLLAIILLKEAVAAMHMIDVDFDELRAKLGLPLHADLDPATVNPQTIRLVDLHRLPPEKLSDEELLHYFVQARYYRAVHAKRRLGSELLNRTSLHSRYPKSQVLLAMLESTAEPNEALKLIHLGRDASVAEGRSPAQWLLFELQRQFERGESAEIEHLLRRIQTQHIREPGVAQALYSLLTRLGVIRPDGRPVGEDSAAPLSAGGPVASGKVPAPAGGKIWTPGSPTADSGDRPKLILPGM